MSLRGFVAFTLERRVTVFVLAALTVVVGLLLLRRLPVELLPPGLTSAELTVMIPVPSANPAEVQESVVRPTEENLRTIPGIKRIVSTARQNGARIRVEFSKSVDLDLAAAEVRDRVERSRPTWPKDVRRYDIFRFNADTDIPILTFGVSFEKRADDLAFVIDERLVKPLEAVPGVARVEVWGLLDDQIRIFIDRDKAIAAGVDLYRLTQDLENSNLDVTAGEITEGGVRYALRTAGRFRSLEDVRSFPVRPGLRLDRIADVRSEQAVRDFVALNKNRFSLWCMVQKESTANTVATCDRVREALRTKIAPDPRFAEFGLAVIPAGGRDAGALIAESLATLRETATDGAWLAVLVLLWFLRRLRLTLVITLAIPFSLLLATIVSSATGGSLNILSLLGVTIAIGMLVDNAIVVVECVQQKRDLGLAPVAAARAGAAEVALPVTLSTLTTVVAFLPLIFMTGDRDATFFTAAIGLPLCYAVTSSLVVALVFVPLGTVLCGRRKGAGAERPFLARLRASPLFDRAASAYARTLTRALRRPGLVAIASVALAGGITAAAWSALPKVDFVEAQGGRLRVEVELDGNFTLNDAYTAFTALGETVASLEKELEISDFWSFFRKTGGNIDVRLKTRNAQKTAAAAERIRAALPRLPGVRVQAARTDDDPERSKTLLRLTGPDPATLEATAREFAARIAAVPGVARAKSDLEAAQDEVRILPDREKLSRFGIVPEALWGTVQYGVRGFPLNEIAAGEREIPLVVQYEGGDETTLAELRSTALFTRAGARVPLSAVSDVAVGRGFSEIRREGGKMGATIEVEYADPATKAATAQAVTDLVARLSLPEGYAFGDRAASESAEGKKEMAIACGMAAVFVFLLMGIMFESFVLPFAVLLSAPFSWAGAVWLLAATKTPLDMIGSIAFILLVGVVVNNGIVLIDCAHRLRLEGLPRCAALAEAGRLRLRPILMTALTTILGLAPTAFAGETNAQISYKALAVAVIGGMSVATLLQLYVVPVAYFLLDDLRRNAAAFFRVVAGGRARGDAAADAGAASGGSPA